MQVFNCAITNKDKDQNNDRDSAKNIEWKYKHATLLLQTETETKTEKETVPETYSENACILAIINRERDQDGERDSARNIERKCEHATSPS